MEANLQVDPAAKKAALAALRAQYEEELGKPPFKGWSATELTSRLTVARAASRRGSFPTAEGEDRVTAVITVDHVFLPLDDDGNVPDQWRDVPGPIDSLEGMSDNEKLELARSLDCKRVTKRTRLTMPKSCADALSAKDQCEVL